MFSRSWCWGWPKWFRQVPQRHELEWTGVWAAIGVCPGKAFQRRWLLTFDPNGKAGCLRAGGRESQRGQHVQRPWGAWSDQRNCGAHLRKIWPGACYQNAYSTNKMTCGTKKGLEIPRRKLAAAWQGDGTLLLVTWYHGLLIYLGLNGSQVLKIKFICFNESHLLPNLGYTVQGQIRLEIPAALDSPPEVF